MAREKNDSSANHGGMRSATMPKKEFERNEGVLGQTCNEKYATEFGNPQDLSRSTAGLASFVKSHKMKY